MENFFMCFKAKYQFQSLFVFALIESGMKAKTILASKNHLSKKKKKKSFARL